MKCDAKGQGEEGFFCEWFGAEVLRFTRYLEDEGRCMLPDGFPPCANDVISAHKAEIAASRTAIPELIEALEEARARIAELEDERTGSVYTFKRLTEANASLIAEIARLETMMPHEKR